jgi:sulfate transport system permease protein
MSEISSTPPTELISKSSPKKTWVKKSVLPGFGLSLGFAAFYASLIVFIPLACLVLKALELSWTELWAVVSHNRALASYKLTFGAALLAASLNLIFGFIVAWVLVRYQFWGKRVVDALVDLPFALPTAVAGIALTALYTTRCYCGTNLYRIAVCCAHSTTGFGRSGS